MVQNTGLEANQSVLEDLIGVTDISRQTYLVAWKRQFLKR